MRGSVLFIVSCDVIERRGLRLKPTQAQSSLGREGKAPSTCRRQVSSCRPSSPFSLSDRRGHAGEPTNNETLKQDVAGSQQPARASGPPKPLPIPMLALCGGAVNSFAVSAWQAQVYKKISFKLRLQNQDQEEINLLRLRADGLRAFRKNFLKQKFD